MLKKCDLLFPGGDPNARYGHIFKSMIDGSKIVVDATHEEYQSLRATGKPEAPDGYDWDCSFAANRYDTPSGSLEEGFYAEEGDSIRVNSGGEVLIKKSVLAELNEALARK